MASEVSKNYIEVLQSLKEKIRQARLHATIAVNNELLKVYWEIGDTILLQQKNEGWGTKVVDRLVTDLKLEFPDMKGLSSRNIKYMRAFAEAYPDFIIVQSPAAQLQNADNEQPTIVQAIPAQLPGKEVSKNKTSSVQAPLAQISWYHHTTLLDKVKEPENRLFYIQKTIENGWSRDVMVHQIESGLHKRQGALTNNFQLTLPTYDSELATQLFKDPYHLDFVMLGEEAKERDLENALMTHITKLLLELGDGFAFMGRQRKFEAGGKEFFIDLLFYNTKLRRHIIIELKVGEFEPEFVSKMNLYLGLADDTLKGEYDEPAIGLILCKTNNKIVAEYALRDTSKPIGIAEYKIAEMLPDDIKGELPSIEVIEQRMDEELKEVQTSFGARLQAIKEKLKQIEVEPLQTEMSYKLLKELFINGLKPMYKQIMKRVSEDFIAEFFKHSISWNCGNTLTNIQELENFWGEEENLKNKSQMVFILQMDGFRKVSTESFSEWLELVFIFEKYWYGFRLHNYNNNVPILKKMYHEPLTQEDIQNVIDLTVLQALDKIESIADHVKSKDQNS